MQKAEMKSWMSLQEVEFERKLSFLGHVIHWMALKRRDKRRKETIQNANP